MQVLRNDKTGEAGFRVGNSEQEIFRGTRSGEALDPEA